MNFSVQKQSQSLFYLLLYSWGALLVVGLVIKLLLAPPAITLLLDRSYCSPDQWQQVSQTYTQLYRQHQQQRSHLQAVIFFSSLGQQTFEHPPSPEDVEVLTTYGQFDQLRQTTLEKSSPNATVLSCHQLP